MFSHLATWWASLHWPAATAIVIAAGSIVLCLWILGINWLRATLGGNRRAIPPRRSTDLPLSDFSKRRKAAAATQAPWHVVDYSPQYREKTEWLGDGGLLATPVKRIKPSSHELGRVVQFERTQR